MAQRLQTPRQAESDDGSETESTEQGEQVLVCGVRPIRLRDRLALRSAQPMAPKRNPHAQQNPCDHGLFDTESRRQIDMLDFLRAAKQGASNPETPKED